MRRVRPWRRFNTLDGIQLDKRSPCLNRFQRLPDNLKGIVFLMLASLDYVRLLWATLFGYLVFDQFPGLPTSVGAAIVSAAAIFPIYREERRKRGWT